MNNPFAMRMIERARNLDGVAQDVGSRQSATRQSVVEGFPFQTFHHQESPAILFADVEEGTDVRMAERGDGARLGLES